MANLGTLWFDTKLKSTAVQDAENIKKQLLHKLGNSIPLSVKLNFIKKDLRSDLQTQLAAFKPKIRVDIIVDQATATKVVQDALAKAGLQNNMTAGMLRAQRAAEIQQRMADRHAESLMRQQRAQQRAAQAANVHANSLLRLNAHLGNGITLGSRFSEAIAGIYSIHLLQTFATKVVEIGGKIEQQQIAMGAILNSQVKSAEMMSKIQSLAVKSPFGIMDLTDYAKQLTAYQIPYNELYDTMKRLADISAGVGVDMGRIILAYGQVRAARFLKGTELRQFTEASIPMVDKLAERFSNLQGRIVSAGEVLDMISKKQVSFDDVKAVLWDMTGEGGVFNNMQEVMSESLAAKWKNLGDAIDVALAKVAKATGGPLKGLAEVLTDLTNNWRIFATALVASVGTYSLAKAANFAYTKSLQAGIATIMADRTQLAALSADQVRNMVVSGNLTREQLLMAVATGKLTAAQAMLAKEVVGVTEAQLLEIEALKARKGLMGILGGGIKALASPTNLAMVGVTLLASLWSAYSSWIDDVENKTKEMVDRSKSHIDELKKQLRLIDSSAKPTDEAALTSVNKQMRQILANNEAYTTDLDEQVKKAKSLSDQYDILKKAISNAIEENKELLDYQTEVGKGFEASRGGRWRWEDINPFGKAENWDLSEMYIFNDSIEKNVEQLNESYAAMRQSIKGLWEYKEALRDAVNELVASGEMSEEFRRRLQNAPLEEQIQLLATSPYWDQIKAKVIEQDASFIEHADVLVKSAGDIAERWGDLANGNIPRIFKEIARNRKMDEKAFREWCANNVDDLNKMLNEMLDRLDEKEPAIRQRFKLIAWNYIRLGDLAKSAAAQGAMALGDALGNFDELFPNKDLADNALDANNNATKNKNKGSSKDTELEKAKTKLDEVKSFLTEYEKYKDLYGKEESINILENLFPTTKGKGQEIVDNFKNVLTGIRNSLPMTSEARKKFGISIDKFIAEYDFKVIKDAVDDAVARTQEYIKDQSQKYDLYKTLFEKTGDKDFAKLAFSDGRIFDDAAKEFASKLQSLTGSTKLNLDMSDADAKEYYKGIAGAYELWKQIVDITSKNYVNALKQSADAQQKSLTNQQKIAILYDKIAEAEKDTSGIDHSAEIKQWRDEISKLESEMLEFLPIYEKIFGDKAYRGYNALKEAENAARELVKNATAGPSNKNTGKPDYYSSFYMDGNEMVKVTMTRQQLERLKKAIDDFFKTEVKENPFKTLGDKVENIFKKIKDKDAKPEQKDWRELAESIKECVELVAQLSSQLADMFDALGKEDLAATFNDINDGLSSISNIANGFAQGGVTGGIVAGAGEAMRWIGKIAKSHDNKLDKAIQNSQREVKKLANAYKSLEEDIERSLGGIYTTGGYDNMLSNLSKQRRELESQLENERKKKKTDKDKLVDYEEQIKELDDQIKYFAEDLAKSLYDIDVHKWAEELGDALFEAWQKGEDGADAFKAKAQEIIADVAKNIAVKKLIEKAMEPVLNSITNEMTRTDGMLDEMSIQRISSAMSMVGGTLPTAFNNLMDGLDAGLKKAGFDSMKEMDEDSSSSLSSGIKGITENTADLLASYINAIRADVSMYREALTMNLPAINLTVQQTNALAQQQVLHQEQIAANTLRNADAAEMIYDILHRSENGIAHLSVK